MIYMPVVQYSGVTFATQHIQGAAHEATKGESSRDEIPADAGQVMRFISHLLDAGTDASFRGSMASQTFICQY